MRSLLVKKEKDLTIPENKVIFELLSANKIIAKTQSFVITEDFFNIPELLVCERIKKMLKELTNIDFEEEFLCN